MPLYITTDCYVNGYAVANELLELATPGIPYRFDVILHTEQATSGIPYRLGGFLHTEQATGDIRYRLRGILHTEWRSAEASTSAVVLLDEVK